MIIDILNGLSAKSSSAWHVMAQARAHRVAGSGASGCRLWRTGLQGGERARLVLGDDHAVELLLLAHDLGHLVRVGAGAVGLGLGLGLGLGARAGAGPAVQLGLGKGLE